MRSWLRLRPVTLRSEVAIVTGASRGIGLAVAGRLAAAGSSVGLIARGHDTLSAAASELRVRHPRVIVASVAADVADADAVEAAIDELTDRLGPPTILVNNAGVGDWGAVTDTEPSTFQRLADVNYLGTVYPTAAVLPGMIERGAGRIVNVASIAGRIGAPFEAAYSASKFAVAGYTEALAVELTGTGVTVSLVNPGPVDTEFFDRRGHGYELASPKPVGVDRVARAVVASARDGRPERFVPWWLRGATVARTVAPPLYRRGIRRTYARFLNGRGTPRGA